MAISNSNNRIDVFFILLEEYYKNHNLIKAIVKLKKKYPEKYDFEKLYDILTDLETKYKKIPAHLFNTYFNILIEKTENFDVFKEYLENIYYWYDGRVFSQDANFINEKYNLRLQYLPLPKPINEL